MKESASSSRRRSDQRNGLDKSKRSSVESTASVDTSAEEVQNVTKNSKAVFAFRTLTVLALIGATTAICVSIYLTLRRQEEADYEDAFFEQSRKVVSAFGRHLSERLDAIDYFGLSLVSHSISMNIEWPKLYLPHFEVRGNRTNSLAGTLSLTVLPLVTNETRAAYEGFSNMMAQKWIPEGLAFQQFWEDAESVLPEGWEQQYMSQIPDQIMSWGPLNESGENRFKPATGGGPYLPKWQSAPALKDTSYVNLDLLSHPQYKDILNAGLKSGRLLIGKSYIPDFWKGPEKFANYKPNSYVSENTMNHDNMGGMDHSSMGGMDHSSMGGMDHSSMGGMDHGSMGGMDHGSMGGMDDGSMGGMDHDSMGQGMDHNMDEGTDQSEGMNHAPEEDAADMGMDHGMEHHGRTLRAADGDYLLAEYLHRWEEIGVTYEGDPITDIVYPLKDSFFGESKVVGLVHSHVNWRSYFQNALPKGDGPLVATIDNNCGQAFSFQIEGSNAFYLGQGHLDMSDDNHYMTMTQFHEMSDWFNVDESDRVNGECSYTVHVQPGEGMKSIYVTNNPLIYMLYVLVAFAMATIFFVLFSFVVEKRHKKLTEVAIQNSEKSVQQERDLNEFIAHEVRNPLSAAITACCFVTTSINSGELTADPDKLETVKEDVEVISTSLNFINDFLRSMLDIQRASGNMIVINNKPTDVLRDVLEPVTFMLNSRSTTGFKVEISCEEDLIILTDGLRLQQVILNLSRNAAKFTEKGFVRMGAEIVNGCVQLFVADSGPGIPVEKRKDLYAKYQSSLDILSQGTGVGLCLSKKLAHSLGGDLILDEKYDSGVKGCPGARFVITLNTAPIDLDRDLETLDPSVCSVDKRDASSGGTTALSSCNSMFGAKDSNHFAVGNTVEEVIFENEGLPRPPSGGGPNRRPVARKTDCLSQKQDGTEDIEANIHQKEQSAPNKVLPVSNKVDSAPNKVLPVSHKVDTSKEDASKDNGATEPKELPDDLSILFVDDDVVLRKLFSRAVKKVSPVWKTDDAASGEKALEMCKTETFDIIFMDQYMSSVDKSLLGTETVALLRTHGVKSKICGLSANDIGDTFMESGADLFQLKPLPVKPDDLKNVMRQLLFNNKDEQQ